MDPEYATYLAEHILVEALGGSRPAKVTRAQLAQMQAILEQRSGK